MDSKMSLRISTFCIYNGLMLYLYISLPHYTLKELKSDIISSCCNYKENPCFRFIRSIIWNGKENRNKSGPLLDEFPSAKDFKEVKSWRVEYDENIHPVAINRNYNYNEKDSEIVMNMLR